VRRKLFVSIAVVALCGASVIALAPAPSSDAAVAPSQQWITAVDSDPKVPATITWGTSGLTATLGAVPAGTPGSCDSTNVATAANIVRFNATTYYSPTPPSGASGVQGCLSGLNSSVSRQVVFNKPVLSPIFHINNLDGSEIRFLAGPSGGPIALDRLSSNVQSQLVGGNILRPASVAGSRGCLVPDPATPNSGIDNSTCGSYRMSEDGGAVKSFTLQNVSRVSGADGYYWSISFPKSTLTKAFSPTTIRQGEEATATFTMSNPAEEAAVPLTGLGFEDALPAGMSLSRTGLTTNGQCGTPALNGGAATAGDTTAAVTGIDLAVGATCTVTITVTTASAGSFTNAASNITADFANLIPTGSTTLQVTAAATPTLTIVKTPTLTDTNSNGTADIGEKVAFSFAVANTGNVDLVDVEVDDPTLSARGVAVTPASVSLAAGGNTSFTSGEYTVTQADIDAGSLSNTATANGVYVESDGDRVPVASEPSTVIVPTPTRAPSVGLTKTATLVDEDDDGQMDVGETVTYDLVVTNTGNVTLTAVTLADAMLGTATPGPIATLAPGASVPFSVDHVARDSDIVNGEILNEASVTATPPSGADVTAADDATLSADTPAPALSIVKTPILTDTNNNGTADAGETITYSFAVENTGNVALVEVTVDDPALAALSIAISPTSASIAEGGGQTFTSAAYTVTQADVDAGSALSNTATAEGVYVRSDAVRIDVASGPSTVTVPVSAQAPAVELVKTAVLADKDGDGRADAGETITYELVVTNTGNVGLSNVTIADPMLGTSTPAPIATLAPAASRQFSIDYEVRESDIVGSEVVNRATVAATAPGGVLLSAADTAALTAQQAPSLLASTGVSVAAASLAAALLIALGSVLLMRRRRIA